MNRYIAGAACALTLTACASIPQGPALTYENLLPNTHENPQWARSAWQTQSRQAAAESAPQPAPAQAPANGPAAAPGGAPR